MKWVVGINVRTHYAGTTNIRRVADLVPAVLVLLMICSKMSLLYCLKFLRASLLSITHRWFMSSLFEKNIAFLSMIFLIFCDLTTKLIRCPLVKAVKGSLAHFIICFYSS